MNLRVDPDGDLYPLTSLLRPAGGGVYLVKTGLQEQKALQQRIYNVADADAVQGAWHRALRRAKSGYDADGSETSLLLMGVPSDIGAGFTRGANHAPAELRAYMLNEEPDHPLLSPLCIDVGDVRVVPQLLSDDMLHIAQLSKTRAALYGDPTTNLPVGALNICSYALDTLTQSSPSAVPIVLGGDHSIGWPAFSAAFERWEKRRGVRLGLLHFDAHTDLLKDRLGVRFCFATWAWHANHLLGEDGRLVQVGIRSSAHPREYWENLCNVRQFWAQEVHDRSIDAVADEIIARFKALGVTALYVSNDIDGTDEAYAASTGTPEPNGLTPDQIDSLTRRIGARFPLIGADLVEVAPPLSRELGEPERTFKTASLYLRGFADLALEGQNKRRALDPIKKEAT